MKIYLFVLILIFNIFSINKSFGEINISYLDIDKVFAITLAGKSINKQISKINKNNLKRINDTKKKLIENEKLIISQKNVLEINEYNNKVLEFQESIKKFKQTNLELEKKINNQKIKATSELLDILNPLMAKYSKDQSISLVIQKKNIIIGKSELDITADIIKLLDNKIKKINID